MVVQCREWVSLDLMADPALVEGVQLAMQWRLNRLAIEQGRIAIGPMTVQILPRTGPVIEDDMPVDAICWAASVETTPREALTQSEHS